MPDGTPERKRRLALIGLGVIGRNRHAPLIARHQRFELAAAARPGPGVTLEGVRLYSDYHALLSTERDLDAVVIATQPRPRYDIALAAMEAGRHVLMEKPPTTTLGEMAVLRAAGQRHGVSLMTAWHSQFNAAVDRARDLLAGRRIAELRMVWEEDGAHFHPNQSWIWESGGFGVLDAGVNGLAILTFISPDPLVVDAATLWVPPGAETPVAVEITFRPTIAGGTMSAGMDWRPKEARREISIVTSDGMRLELAESGRHLIVDGKPVIVEENREYERLYDRFAGLIDAHESLLDEEPLRLVADVFLLGKRQPA